MSRSNFAALLHFVKQHFDLGFFLVVGNFVAVFDDYGLVHMPLLLINAYFEFGLDYVGLRLS